VANKQMMSGLGPRVGVEPAENNMYRPAVYLDNGKIELSDRRLPYGAAFSEAFKMSEKYLEKRLTTI
jgi:hypothetical protein